MVLYFPSRLGNEAPASPEAENNLYKLLRVNQNSREQVATNVALEYAKKAYELRPGYFSGAAAWVKSGGAWVAGGAASTAAIAAVTAAAIKGGLMAWEKDPMSTLTVGAGALSLTLTSHLLGYNPIGAAVAFAALAVRDSANRAADWSIGRDAHSLETKEKEAKECREEVLNQLQIVYDDMAKFLRERYSYAEISRNADEILMLKNQVQQLENNLPTIKYLLKKFELSTPEVENVLQKLTGSLHFVREQGCRLQSEPSYEEMNAKLLAGWPAHQVRDIAVPHILKERIQTAKDSRYGILDQLSGCGSAVFSGLKAITAWTVALVVVAGGVSLYVGTDKAQEYADGLFTSLKDDKDLVKKAILASSVIASPAIPVIAGKYAEHQQVMADNAIAVNMELSNCSKELKDIYDGIASYLQQAGHIRNENGQTLCKSIQDRLPAIRREVAALSLVREPSMILENLEKAVR